MKLLVFAHTPPPHHGQSYMVKLMLDGFGGDVRRKRQDAASTPLSASSLECYHVNSRFSDGMEDIGEVRFEKGFLLLRYCLEAIWCRIRYGVRALYYVPAPGKRAALYRDWIILFLCRPFFPHVILHWHAVGLGDWVKREGNCLERWITHRLLSRCTLSVALAVSSMRDALWFLSRDIKIVPNGIPDPCPEFDTRLLPVRLARAEARRSLLAGEPLAESSTGDPAEIRALYIAHCTRDKGVFDALDGVAVFNRQNTKLRVHLTVAGSFLRECEEQEFHRRIAQPDLAGAVTYSGFVQGAEKARLFKENDCLCFPTYYIAEGQPVNLIEAMAFGMSIITTRWRAIPEILPPGYPGFTSPKAPQEFAEALERIAPLDLAEPLRARYLAAFSEEKHLENMAKAISNTEKQTLKTIRQF
ncbi:MAG: glycosyltransferase family 4 protein [Verrucomicrobiota bacterium]